jgi:hypothetical protein
MHVPYIAIHAVKQFGLIQYWNITVDGMNAATAMSETGAMDIAKRLRAKLNRKS